jgi:ABC-type amino acid transport substrate-binding protein
MFVNRYVILWCATLSLGGCARGEMAPEAAPAAQTQTTRATATPTLDGVRRKGFVQCGVSTGVGGFSAPDAKGHWQGLDVDVCRAVAAAVLGDATKVRFTPLTAVQRFTALQTGEIDVLARVTSITFQRDIQLGIEFPATYCTRPRSSARSCVEAFSPSIRVRRRQPRRWAFREEGS